MNQNFYIYEHLKLSDNSVFYVGKGCNRRAFQKANRNQHWHNIVKKHGYKVNFIAKNLTEELALLAEIEKIDQLKRLNVKLCNQTNGGDGVSGYVATKETRLKLSIANTGKKPSAEAIRKMSMFHKGRAKSEETKQKIRAANLGKKRSEEVRLKISIGKSKPVICFDTNEIFNNTEEASIAKNINKTSINRACQGVRKTAGGMRWGYK